MKLHLTTLAAALATALTAGTAHAAIDSDGGVLAFNGTGDGELFFSAISPVDQKSITIDLGVTASAFRANPAAGFMQTYSELASFLSSASGPVRFNVAGISNVNLFAGADPADWGILTTAPAPIGQLLSSGQNEIAEAMSAANNFILNINLFSGTTDVAQNLVTEVSDPSSFAYHNGGFWGSRWGGKMPFITDASVGDALPFYFVDLDLANFGDGTVAKGTEILPGFAWMVSSDGTIKFASTDVAPIPLPAAAWLFGSALVGGVLAARRRKA